MKPSIGRKKNSCKPCYCSSGSEVQEVMNYSYCVSSDHESKLWVWLVFVFFAPFDSSFKCTRSSTPAESENSELHLRISSQPCFQTG